MAKRSGKIAKAWERGKERRLKKNEQKKKIEEGRGRKRRRL